MEQLKNGFKSTVIGKMPSDWEILKLGDLGKFSKGSGVKKDESNSGNLPCVRYGELYTKHNNYIKSFHSFISKEVALQAKKINYGDILFAGSGETKEEIGKCASYVNKFEAYAGGDIVILSISNDNPIFLGYLLNAPLIQFQKSMRGQGDAVVHISSSNLASIIIPRPSLAEQTAIAEALTDIDVLISQTKKLIEKKKAIKQGAMQELLKPKEGWELRKFGEIGNIEMCRRIFNEETSPLGKIPFFKIGTFGKEPDAYISEELFIRYKTKFSYPKKGDILISAAGTIGRTIIYDGSPAYFQDSNIVWIDNDESIVSNHFLYYVLQNVRYKTEGGTIQRLYNSILRNTQFFCPPICEQIRVYEILSEIDKQLTELEIKWNKFQMLKQGMMQELLTGKTRLI